MFRLSSYKNICQDFTMMTTPLDKLNTPLDKLNTFYKKNEIPHIIFHGSPGSGKKTIVHSFIQTIYNDNADQIKENVMYVQCSQGKGIKFIRDELISFAKRHATQQVSSSVTQKMFKIIVLLNADLLTDDAQSALRRCIELFSNNTRFFIVVENISKLLTPIVSRFCDIYVPMYDNDETIINLSPDKSEFIHKIIKSNSSYSELVTKVTELYENGIHCLDLVQAIDNIDVSIYYYKVKTEFRSEKLLLFCLLDFYYYSQKSPIQETEKRLLQISSL